MHNVLGTRDGELMRRSVDQWVPLVRAVRRFMGDHIIDGLTGGRRAPS